MTLQASDSVTTVLRLASIQLLEGVVQDGQGRPLAQAALFAWPAGGAQVGVVESSSGSDGRFALAGLSPGSWTLMVEAPGFGTLRLERVDVPSRPLVLRLQGEVRTLGGVVVGADGGFSAGCAGPALRAGAVHAPRGHQQRQGDLPVRRARASGRFVVRASTGQRVSTPQAVVIDAETGWLPPVKLTLGPGAMLAGRVVDDTGRPLARADVEPVAAPTDDAPGHGQDRQGRPLHGRAAGAGALPGLGAADRPRHDRAGRGAAPGRQDRARRRSGCPAPCRSWVRRSTRPACRSPAPW